MVSLCYWICMQFEETSQENVFKTIILQFPQQAMPT